MEVQCSFDDITWGFDNKQKLLYTCNITDVSITEPGTEIKAFIGNHQQGKTNNDVTAISFEDSPVHFFPRNLHNIFPNLLALQIDDCDLKIITRRDLVGLKNLERLTMLSNQLRSLPSDLFIGFGNLKYIWFGDNKLEFLSSKLLEPILGNQLERVNFKGNTKINAFYEPGEKGSVASLQELMKIIDQNCEPPKDKLKEEFKKTFAAGFEELWTSKDFADFTIIGGFDGASKEFAVHKIVLAAQSSVLLAVFKNDNMEEAQTGKMTIDDFSAETVEGMLKFMYTGEVNESIAMDLLAIAEKYDVKNLKAATEMIILHNINESNALEIFGLGYQHNSKEIKREAFNKIKKMFPEIKFSDELMEKPKDLKEIIEIHLNFKRKIEEAEEERRVKMQKFD
jgi:Leucine-rich repeat (LRR) protein